MATKSWSNKPKILPYVLGTLVLAIGLSGVVFLASQIKIGPPASVVSTSKNPLPSETTPTATTQFKLQVQNEIDKMTTLSAELKDSDSWLSIELPKLSLTIDFSK